MSHEVCALDLCDETGIWHDRYNEFIPAGPWGPEIKVEPACTWKGIENDCCEWAFCSCVFGEKRRKEYEMKSIFYKEPLP